MEAWRSHCLLGIMPIFYYRAQSIFIENYAYLLLSKIASVQPGS